MIDKKGEFSMGKSSLINHFVNTKINGMHYIRELSSKDIDMNGMEINRINGYLIIDNQNKPVKRAYQYLKHCKNYGDSFNTIKRKAYDLCYFLDFLIFSKIDEEMMNYEYFFEFVSDYLTIIDPKFKVRDCIERSMMISIPVLPAYTVENVRVQNKNNVGGLDYESIRKIANTAKNYLCYLKFHREFDIEIYYNDMFKFKDVRIKDITNSGYSNTTYMRIYSIDHILKNANIPFVKELIKPIDTGLVFENYEMKKFFKKAKECKNPSYKLLFHLLSITGMRISEALALMIFKINYNGKDIDFMNMESDIKLVNDNEDLWEVNIIVRPDNPSDLKVKFNKPRNLKFYDTTKQFRSLLEQTIIDRKLKFQKNKSNHTFLFVNQSGNRLKYHTTEETFSKIIVNAGLGDLKSNTGSRLTKLTLHSMRHTFASRWVRDKNLRKMDIEVDLLSKYLGHASSDTTRKIYIHFFEEEEKQLISQMESASYQMLEDEEE